MGRQSSETAVRIDRDTIVEVGLRLLEEQGFEQLSLRRIADCLGVQTPALYWYIRDRAELYGLMAEVMLHESLATIDPRLTGGEFLVALGRELHRTHLTRRDAAKLIALANPSAEITETLMPSLVARLSAGGIGPAYEALSAVYSFTLGWSLFQANESVAQAMARRVNVDEAFERGLFALADGFGRAD